MIKELVQCSDPNTGYLYFLENFFYIQHPVKGKLLFKPYEYQKGLLSAYHNYRFNVNMIPRQMGKCLAKETIIRIKNKHTGEIREIPIGDFFEMQKKK